MGSEIIQCTHCGQKNRIGETKPGRIWTCVTCQSKLLSRSEYAETICPECGTDFTAIVPAWIECPSCDHVFEADEEGLCVGNARSDGSEAIQHDHDEVYRPIDSSLFARARSLEEEIEVPFEGYAPLLEITDQELYRRNAFRILAVDIERSDREIASGVEHRRMMQKLGRNDPAIQGVFSIQLVRDMDALRAAVQRLCDPEQRLLQEFFWFWPVEFGSARTDVALSSLARGDVEAASRCWLENERSPTASAVCNHNLAILSHLTALDLQFVSRTSELSTAEKNQLDFNWEQALTRWADLVEDDEFWVRLRADIRTRGDSRVTDETSRRIRETLPVAVLSINAALAAEAAEKDQINEANEELNRIHGSYFDKQAINESLRRAAIPIRERVKSICKKAREDSKKKPNEAAGIAHAILRDLYAPLNALSCLLNNQGPLVDAAHDEVALVVLECAQAYRYETRDWAECFELLEEATLRARSDSLRASVSRDVEITRSGWLSSYLDPLFEEIKSITDSDLTAAEKLKRLSEEIPPEIEKLREVEDQSQEIVSIAGDMLARALRSVSIDLHNETEDYEKALEAIELAATYCADEELASRILQDEALLQKRVKQEHMFAELKPIDSAPGLRTVNGIGTTLYGRSDYDEETRSYLTTLYFVVLFLPILPIARYRVIQEQQGRYRFLGKARLRRFDKIHLAGAAVAALVLVLMMLDEGSQSKTGQQRSVVSSPPPPASPPPQNVARSPASVVPAPYQPTVKVQPPATQQSAASDPELNGLKQEIDSGKIELAEVKSQIDSLRAQFKSCKSTLEYYASRIKRIEADIEAGEVIDRAQYKADLSQHNYYVELHNSLLRDLESKIDQHNRLLADVNGKVDEYNRRIRLR